jgi:hypothetical protein
MSIKIKIQNTFKIGSLLKKGRKIVVQEVKGGVHQKPKFIKPNNKTDSIELKEGDSIRVFPNYYPPMEPSWLQYRVIYPKEFIYKTHIILHPTTPDFTIPATDEPNKTDNSDGKRKVIFPIGNPPSSNPPAWWLEIKYPTGYAFPEIRENPNVEVGENDQ